MASNKRKKHMNSTLQDEDGNVLKSGMSVPVKNGNIDKAIKHLKRRRTQEGYYKEMKKQEYYEKPTERKKRKQREAIRRWKKKKQGMEW